jgi:hypothetical protein
MTENKRPAPHNGNNSPFEEPTRPLKESEVEAMVRQTAGRRMVRKASMAVKEHISRQPHVQRLFSFMPTLMTRISPFHFRNKNTAKNWPLVRLDSGTADAWGRMQVVGELLIIFDETVLFSLLALMGLCRNDAFETSERELCRLAAIDSTAANRNAVWNSIRRLTGTRIDLELTTGKGKKHKTVKQMTGAILSFADRDRAGGTIRVVVNPYFLEMYGESFVTNIDLAFRSSLRTDLSKAVYRFFQGQIGTESDIGIRRLASAVNLETDATPAGLKRKIRTALQELTEKAYLTEFRITPDHRVQTVKSPHTAIQSEGMVSWRFA